MHNPKWKFCKSLKLHSHNTNIDKQTPFHWLHNSWQANHFPSQLTNTVQYGLEQAVQFDTDKGYKSSYKQFTKFCDQFTIPYWPIDDLTMAYFFAWRLRKVKASTILTNYSGIKHIAKIYGYPIDDKQMPATEQWRKTLHGLFGKGEADQRRPVTTTLLTEALPHFNLKQFNELVYYTAMVCATVGLMRTSEIFAKNKQVRAHHNDRGSARALFMRNLSITRDTNGKISFYTVKCRATKTDKGHCDVDIVWSKGKWPISPADLLTTMLKARHELSKRDPRLKITVDSPLFMLRNGTIATRWDMNTRFKKLVTQMGLDPTRFKLYSFRIGGATSLAQRGVDHGHIQLAGRWRSDAYRIYIRLTSQMMADRQAHFFSLPVVDPSVVFLHQNIPDSDLIRS